MPSNELSVVDGLPVLGARWLWACTTPMTLLASLAALCAQLHLGSAEPLSEGRSASAVASLAFETFDAIGEVLSALHGSILQHLVLSSSAVPFAPSVTAADVCRPTSPCAQRLWSCCTLEPIMWKAAVGATLSAREPTGGASGSDFLSCSVSWRPFCR